MSQEEISRETDLSNSIAEGKRLRAEDRPLPGSEAADNTHLLQKIGWGKSDDRYRMDGNKLPWHKERLESWAKGENISPLHIDMGIVTGCNLGCHFCYGVVQERAGFLGKLGQMKSMSLETIKSVFEDAKDIGVKSVALIGEGENTLNPNLYPAVQYARDIKFDLSLATHGANIRQEHVEPLMTSLQWVRLNLSAATPESYQRVHQRDFYQRVMDATNMLVQGRQIGLRNHRGLETTIGFQMVLTDRNMDQIVPLARLGKDMGIDYTVIKACSDTPDKKLNAPDKEYLALRDTFLQAEAESTSNYKVIVRWQKLGNLGNKDYSTCHGTRFITALSGDGTLFPCGHWFAIERDRFSMGNVNEKRLREIVTSDRYWEVQREIHKIDLRYCETNCRQHGVNRTLHELSKEGNVLNNVEKLETPEITPPHINFV